MASGSKTWQLGPKLCLLKTVLAGFYELGSWFISGQCVEVVFVQFLWFGHLVVKYMYSENGTWTWARILWIGQLLFISRQCIGWDYFCSVFMTWHLVVKFVYFDNGTWTWACSCILMKFTWHRHEFLWVMWNLSLCLIIVEPGHVCIWSYLNLGMFVYMKDSSVQYVTWDSWTWAYMKDSWT